MRVSGGQMRFSGGNEANRVLLNPDASGGIAISDPTKAITAGTGCRSVAPTAAVCSGNITRITIAGSGGNDTMNAASMRLPVTLDGSEGNDTMVGGAGNDTIDGDDGNDTIDGGVGNDTITADAGNDIIDGGFGADTIHGGSGTDTLSYADRPSPVTVDLDGNADDGGPGEKDRVESDIERVIGGPFDDTLTAISGTHTLDGGPGNDTLRGGTGKDTLIGGPGNDTLNGGTGSDVLRGGDGVDTADYNGGFDPVTVDLTRGRAFVDRGSGSRRVRDTDTLDSIENAVGTSKADTLIGSAGPNVLTGGPGNDTFDGRFGADVMVGGAGLDTVSYASRRAPVSVTFDGLANDGGAGEGDNISPSIEDAIGGTAGDSLVGSSRRNHLFGGDGRDTITGGGGGDTIDGGPGADDIDGGAGRDMLIGGRGLDTVRGGASNDVIDLRDHERDAVECGTGVDRVLRDKIDRVDPDCERLVPAK